MRQALLQKYYEGDEYKAKLRERLEVLMLCDKDPLKITELVVDRWALNPITFIEQFGWILNPKFNNSTKPMFLFKYQKDIIEKLWQAELSGTENEFLIDKPREMGLTWLIVWYYIWRFLFTRNWSGAILSRSEGEVDDGTSDPSKSIFGKIRWGLQHLPVWLIPDGFAFKSKKGTNTDSSLRISNPQMASTIVGSTANQNAFRGSRFSFSWTDECFFIEHFWPAHRSIAHIANTRLYVSTSKVGRSYQKYVDNRKEANRYISLSYQDNPFKDEIWYKEKEKEAEVDPEALKEIMVSYAVNSTMQYYPEISQAKISAEVIYDRKRPLFVSLDYGRSDHTVLIWWQFDGVAFNILECVARNKVDFNWFAPYLNPALEYDKDKYFGYHKDQLEKVRTWKKPLAYFGETAHKQVHYPSNTSVQKELLKYGVKLMMNDYAQKYEVRRKALSMLLPKMVFNSNSDEVMELYDCIQNSRYAGSTKGMSKEALMKPAHDDEVGDYRSALENGAANIGRVLRTQRAEIQAPLKEDGFIGNLIKFLRV